MNVRLILRNDNCINSMPACSQTNDPSNKLSFSEATAWVSDSVRKELFYVSSVDDKRVKILPSSRADHYPINYYNLNYIWATGLHQVLQANKCSWIVATDKSEMCCNIRESYRNLSPPPMRPVECRSRYSPAYHTYTKDDIHCKSLWRSIPVAKKLWGVPLKMIDDLIIDHIPTNSGWYELSSRYGVFWRRVDSEKNCVPSYYNALCCGLKSR